MLAAIGLALGSILLWPFTVLYRWLRVGNPFKHAQAKRIVILGLDGQVASANPRARELLGPELGMLVEMEAGETRVVAGPGGRRLRCTRASFLDRGFRRSFFLVDDLTRELRAFLAPSLPGGGD